jgi:hypothetical protein
MMIDEMELVGRLGEVDTGSAEAIDRAEVILRAAMAAAYELEPEGIDRERRMRWPKRRALAGVAAAAVVVAGVAGGLSIARSGSSGSPTTQPQASRPVAPSQPVAAVLTASRVRLIASTSTAAVAESGTAVETTTTTNSGVVQGTPTTIDVTFSGQNVNYTVANNSNGAQGVQDRVVDGQLYLYFEGPDLQMHWYHDTTPNAAAGLGVPNPRTLLEAVTPSAGLENLGQQSVGGVELTHLRATTPSALGQLGLPDITGTVMSFDIWIDTKNVVRQLAVASSTGTALNCRQGTQVPANEQVITTLPDGKPVPTGYVCGYVTSGSTLKVSFANLGAPETVAAPNGAIDQRGKG